MTCVIAILRLMITKRLTNSNPIANGIPALVGMSEMASRGLAAA